MFCLHRGFVAVALWAGDELLKMRAVALCNEKKVYICRMKDEGNGIEAMLYKIDCSVFII